MLLHILFKFLLFPPYLLGVPGNIDVVSVKQAIQIAGSNKSNMGGGGNIGREIKGLWNLAGVAAVHVIGLQGGPRWAAIV